jgi:solute carrier family 15 oligopeptide transporter 1
VAETKQLFRVLAVFIPFPLFWALFEQQGSRWIVQAKRMNGALVSFKKFD